MTEKLVLGSMPHAIQVFLFNILWYAFRSVRFLRPSEHHHGVTNPVSTVTLLLWSISILILNLWSRSLESKLHRCFIVFIYGAIILTKITFGRRSLRYSPIWYLIKSNRPLLVQENRLFNNFCIPRTRTRGWTQKSPTKTNILVDFHSKVIY